MAAADTKTSSTDRKTVLIDARESGTSTGRYVDKLIEHMHSLKPEFRIVVLTKEHRVSYVRKIAPSFEVIETAFKEFTFGEQLGLKKQIEALQPDLVHFSIVQQPVLYRKPKISTMHDLTTVRFRNPSKNWLVFTLKQSVYKWVNKDVARRSNRVLTATQFVKDDIVAYTGIDPSKVVVTPEAADQITEHARGFQSLHDDDFIMYVGRPMPHKNLERLIDAFAILKDSHPQLKLVLAGKKDDLYARIEAGVKQRHLNDVVFTGFVSDGQLRWLYENCRAYVFPSLSEGFGLPGVEAMMHGAPVISSNATCLPEVNGNAAHYFDPLDIHDMALKIGEVLEDKKLRTKLMRAGKLQARTYSWTRMAEQTLAVYRDVLHATDESPANHTKD